MKLLLGLSIFLAVVVSAEQSFAQQRFLLEYSSFSANQMPIWFAEGVRFYFVAWSLDAMLPPSSALFLALISSLATVSPITPAGLGVVEAIVISVLPLVGVSGDAAAAIAILDRMISYWSLILVGLPLYVMYVRRDVASAVQQEPSSA